MPDGFDGIVTDRHGRHFCCKRCEWEYNDNDDGYPYKTGTEEMNEDE